VTETNYCPNCGVEIGGGTSVDYSDPEQDPRSRKQKLKALIKKDIDPEITRAAENALERREHMGPPEEEEG